MTDRILHAGEIVILTSGEYSGFGIMETLRVLVDFDPIALYEEIAALPVVCRHCGRSKDEHEEIAMRSDWTMYKCHGAVVGYYITHGPGDLLLNAIRARGLAEPVECPTIHCDDYDDPEDRGTDRGPVTFSR